MKRFSKTAALAATAAFAAFLTLPAGIAGGATVPDQSYRLASEGTFSIGATDFAIPTAGTGITGTWDNETGAFTGDLTVGGQTITGYPSGIGATTVQLVIAMTSPGVTGTLDPLTGAVALTAPVNIEIKIWLEPVAGDPLATCTLGPVNLVMSSTNPGGSPFTPTDAPDTWAFTVTRGGFNVPASACDNPAITPIFNDTLGVPTSETSVALSFESGVPAPPVPPPVPPPVEPPQVGAAEAAPDAAAGGADLPRTGAATPLLAATGLGLLLAGIWFVRAQTGIRRYRDT